MIKANILLDSISENGKRLTTFELTLPKQLLAQLNTHRSLSKNAASARAIPTKKFISSVKETPVMPVWTENRPGMTGEFITDPETLAKLDALWLKARDLNIAIAEEIMAAGGHKQSVNRLLEPWFYAKIVLSATELDWFYYLRDSSSAQEEIAILARAMREAQESSTPRLTKIGEWHIPYILPEEADLPVETKLKVSVARCARTSYQTHDTGLTSVLEKDIKLFDQLFAEKHLSPFEHSATPALSANTSSSNFKGWRQYRERVQ